MALSGQKHDAEELQAMAAAAGLEDDYYFRTTFERYQMQLYILDELKKTILEDGLQVEKEYVKGRKNVYSHPAVADYNRTTDSANKTVTTLIRIIKSFGNVDGGEASDPLADAINGGPE